MIFLKLIFMFNFINTIIILTITVDIANNVKKVNTDRNKHICQKILFALLSSIVLVDTTLDALATILVIVPVDAVFSGGYKPINPICQPLHCTLH